MNKPEKNNTEEGRSKGEAQLTKIKGKKLPQTKYSLEQQTSVKLVVLKADTVQGSPGGTVFSALLINSPSMSPAMKLSCNLGLMLAKLFAGHLRCIASM